MIVTRIDRFIALNKHRDDIVGDLCKDLCADKNFPFTQDDQLDYLEQLGQKHYWVREPIKIFLQAVVDM